MKTIKFLFLGFMLFSVYPIWAQGLGPDFVCSGKTADEKPFEVVINNYDFMKEISFKYNSKICNLPIIHSSYTERGAAAVMILNFEMRESCPIRKVKFLEKGFLKVQLHKNSNEAHVLALTGQPLECQVSSFNKNKLKSRIESR